MKALIAGFAAMTGIALVLGFTLACLLAFAVSLVTPGCATPLLPTAQENSDYCQGQRTICTAKCPEVPPSGPCLRDCQDDHAQCLQMETQP